MAAPAPLVSLFTEVDDSRWPQARLHGLENILLMATWLLSATRLDYLFLVLPAVGIILVISLFITPAAAACWRPARLSVP